MKPKTLSEAIEKGMGESMRKHAHIDFVDLENTIEKHVRDYLSQKSNECQHPYKSLKIDTYCGCDEYVTCKDCDEQLSGSW